MDSKKTKFVLTAESVFVMQITQVSVFIVQYYWEKKECYYQGVVLFTEGEGAETMQNHDLNGIKSVNEDKGICCLQGFPGCSSDQEGNVMELLPYQRYKK